MSARKARREIDKAIGHLMEYDGPNHEWAGRLEDLEREFLSPVADKLDMDFLELSEFFGAGPYAHMVFGFLFEEYASVAWNNEEHSLIGAYLKYRGWREGTAGRRYLQALDQAELGFWEVVTVKPGVSVDLRPYGSDKKPIRVKEKAATESLHQWDGLAARVLRIDRENTFSGAMLSFRPDQAERLQSSLTSVSENMREMMEALVEEGEIETLPENIDQMGLDEQYNELARIALGVWSINAYLEVTSSPPEMRNTDDEPIELTQLRFPVQGERALIASVLNAAPSLDNDGGHTDKWVWLPRPADEFAVGEQMTILGHILLTDETVQLDINSRGRALRGCAFFSKLLEGLVGTPLTVHENMERLGEMGGREEQPLADSPEMQKLMESHLTQHYRETLDEPIPMLNGKTPRECAIDPASKKDVIGWLKYLENSNTHSGQKPYDFGWIWKELKLDRN